MLICLLNLHGKMRIQQAGVVYDGSILEQWLTNGE